MWTNELTADSPLAPEAIWTVLADIDNWSRWDTSLESVKLQGPFTVGTRVSMTPKGQDPITSVIAEIKENEFYADETDMGEVTLRFSHALTRLPDGGTRIVHRLEIGGPAADDIGPELGPAITEDFPDAMSALLARAAGLCCGMTSDESSSPSGTGGDGLFAGLSAIEGPSYSPGFWLWHATLRWQREIATALTPFGLTHVQFVLLACAWWMNDHGIVPNQLELARQAGTDVKMTSQVVRKLEAKGLLERDTDPGDTRARRLRVTPEGAELALRAIEQVDQADAAFFRPVTSAGTSTQTVTELFRLLVEPLARPAPLPVWQSAGNF